MIQAFESDQMKQENKHAFVVHSDSFSQKSADRINRSAPHFTFQIDINIQKPARS